MGERVSINTGKYILIQEPGLRPPALRLNYATPGFQKLVLSCFGEQLPRIRFTEAEVPYFEHWDSARRETCILAGKVSSMKDIPRPEVIRLLEGWLRVQTKAMDPDIGLAEAGMMQTFLLPDPERDLRQYRVYLDPHCQPRLHVLWGFSTKAKPSTAILAEQAIAILLGVETDVLGELAEAECDPEVYAAWVQSLQLPPGGHQRAG